MTMPVAFPWIDVAADDGVLRVRIELDAAVGVPIDPVVLDHGAAGLLDVDAVVMVGARETPAVVHPVAADHGGDRASVPHRAEPEADGGVVVGHVVVEEADASGVHGGARQPAGVAPVQVEALDREVVGAACDPDPADDAYPLAVIGPDHHGCSGPSTARDLDVAPVDAAAQAAPHAGAKRLAQSPDRAEWLADRAPGAVRAARGREAVAAGLGPGRASTGASSSGSGRGWRVHRGNDGRIDGDRDRRIRSEGRAGNRGQCAPGHGGAQQRSDVSKRRHLPERRPATISWLRGGPRQFR